MDNPIVTQIDADQEPNPKPPVPGHKHVDNLQYSQPRSIFGKTLSEESDAPNNSTDLNGESQGEAKLEYLLRKHDEEKIKRCNDDIDSLLVFSGLSSAVLATFSVQSYGLLQEDSNTSSERRLMQFAQQLWGPASASNISIVAFPPFEVPSFAVRVNALWFGSLICSLVTASLAILMKQWFREYLSWDCAATEERIRVRYVRYSGLTRWRIFDIAAALPLLLQASLILFFIGLVEWLRVADNAVWLSAMSLVACWLSLYLLAIVASIFSSRCPYKTPFLDPWVQRSRGFLTRWRYGEDWHKKMGHDNSYYEFPGDEKGIRRDSKLDIPALVSADRTLGSNHVLAECMQSCLRRVDGETVILITRKLFEHRLGYPIALLSDIRGFERIPSDALDALLRILINAVERELPSSTISWSSWISEALSCICSIVAHVQSPPKRNVNTSGASKLLTSLLSLNIDIVEGLFTTLLQTRPKIMWQLRNPSRSDDPVIPTLLQVGRRIADSGLKYDPLRVAGEILFIMRSADPRILRYSSPQFSQLIRDLIPIISSHLPSTSLPPEKSYIKRILITCKELNVRLPRLVDYRLEEILERILGELPHGQPLSRTLARKPMGKRLFGTESQRFSTTSEETFQLERLKNAEDSLPASRNPTPQPSTANHETVTPYPSPSFPPFRNPQAETPLDRGKRPRSRSLYRTPTGRQTQVIPPVPPLPSTRSSVDYTDLLLAATLIEPPTGNPSRPPPTAFRQRTPVRHRDRRTSNVFKENHPLDGNEMVVTVPRFPIYEYDD